MTAPPPPSSSGPDIDPVLEAAYNCRAAVPDHEEIFSRWAETGAAARREAEDRMRRDIRYAEGNRCTLDLFGVTRPAMRRRPLLIFLHGGYWQAMDKSSFSGLARPFMQAGAAVAIVNYPLCPEASLRTIIAAVREAVMYLWHEAHPLGLDRHRFVVAGHSAGGHLVAELLCTRWPSLDPSMPLDTLAGGIAISGLFDLIPLVRTSLNGALGLDTATAEQLSPLFRNPVPGVSLTLAVGEFESDAFHDQSARLAHHWAAHGAGLTWFLLRGCNHFTALEAFGESAQRLHHDALGRLGLGARPSPADRLLS